MKFEMTTKKFYQSIEKINYLAKLLQGIFLVQDIDLIWVDLHISDFKIQIIQNFEAYFPGIELQTKKSLEQASVFIEIIEEKKSKARQQVVFLFSAGVCITLFILKTKICKVLKHLCLSLQ